MGCEAGALTWQYLPLPVTRPQPLEGIRGFNLATITIEYVCWPSKCMDIRPPETIEEELEIISQALEAGIDPFPPKKEPTRWAKLALGWFMIIMMVSWVSQLLFQYV